MQACSHQDLLVMVLLLVLLVLLLVSSMKALTSRV
jgi:hypothetical protein